MRSAAKCICILLFLAGLTHASGQDMQTEVQPDGIEKQIDFAEAQPDYADVIYQEEALLKHPVNLNTSDKDALLKLTLLSPGHIEAIRDHIRQYGPFRSVYELQVIEGFDPELIQNILPYITIKENPLASELAQHYTQQVILSTSRRLEKSKAYLLPGSDPNAFRGNPYRHVIRYGASLGKRISFGFSAEKDEGEKSRDGFFSPYLQLQSSGWFKQLVAGDFQASFGQGLCFGSGLNFGKSSFVLDIMRRQNSLRPNRAFNENELMRGLGCSVKLMQHIIFTTFYSYRRIDANTVTDSTQGETFTSLSNTGLYRNAMELSERGILKRRITGFNLQASLGQLQIGATAVVTKYGARQAHEEKDLYQLYHNSSAVIYNMGIDYKYFHRNLLFFGETAMNQGISSLSSINGVIASLGKHIDISLLYRHYSKHYTPSISNAFGETQDNRNESGCYMALSLTPFRNCKLNAYADIYHSSWLRYKADAPSSGRDAFIELQYTKRRQLSWYVRFRNEQKQQNEIGTQVMNRLETHNKSQLRLHLEVHVQKNIMLKSRIEQVWYSKQSGTGSRGMLMFQDLQVQVLPQVKILARLMYFDAVDYDSRVFAYENDMLYAFSTPAFQDRGTRFYILCKYKINKNLYLCYRFARTSYENTHTTGSSYDKIDSNKTTDTGIQIQWTL